MKFLGLFFLSIAAFFSISAQATSPIDRHFTIWHLSPTQLLVKRQPFSSLQLPAFYIWNQAQRSITTIPDDKIDQELPAQSYTVVTEVEGDHLTVVHTAAEFGTPGKTLLAKLRKDDSAEGVSPVGEPVELALVTDAELTSLVTSQITKFECESLGKL